MGRARLTPLAAAPAGCALPAAGAGAVPAQRSRRARDNALERLVEGDGGPPGDTRFIGASGDGRRSATVAINQQITASSGQPAAFARLRRAFAGAVWAALAMGR